MGYLSFASSFDNGLPFFSLLPTGSVSWMWISPSLRTFLFWDERWLLQEVPGWERTWPVALIAGFLLGISAMLSSSLLKYIQIPNVEPAAVEDSQLKQPLPDPHPAWHTLFRVTLPLFFLFCLFKKLYKEKSLCFLVKSWNIPRTKVLVFQTNPSLPFHFFTAGTDLSCFCLFKRSLKQTIVCSVFTARF